MDTSVIGGERARLRRYACVWLMTVVGMCCFGAGYGMQWRNETLTDSTFLARWKAENGSEREIASAVSVLLTDMMRNIDLIELVSKSNGLPARYAQEAIISLRDRITTLSSPPPDQTIQSPQPK